MNERGEPTEHFSEPTHLTAESSMSVRAGLRLAWDGLTLTLAGVLFGILAAILLYWTADGSTLTKGLVTGAILAALGAGVWLRSRLVKWMRQLLNVDGRPI